MRSHSEPFPWRCATTPPARGGDAPLRRRRAPALVSPCTSSATKSPLDEFVVPLEDGYLKIPAVHAARLIFGRGYGPFSELDDAIVDCATDEGYEVFTQRGSSPQSRLGTLLRCTNAVESRVEPLRFSPQRNPPRDGPIHGGVSAS